MLKTLFWPLTFLMRLLIFPFRLRSRYKVAEKYGWLELHLEGEVLEHRRGPRLPPIVRRLLRKKDPPRVVLSRLRKLVHEAVLDPGVKGVLVRLGLLGGGWTHASEIQKLLRKLVDADKKVLVHIASHAGNRELLVAMGGSKILMTPSGAIAAVGTAATGLFLKETLEKVGVHVEVAAKGRFKSAPDRYTRVNRTAFDAEQTKALIDAFDEEILTALMTARDYDRAQAEALVDDSPMVGVTAHKAGHCDGLARDEDLIEEVKDFGELVESPELIGAGTYLEARTLRSPFSRRKKTVGIVEAHGVIVDRAPGYAEVLDRMSVEKAVVNDLRAALEDKTVGAVVLHINSRGGSVTASDAICSAVRRLVQTKPVVACFGDVAASGGYFIACGAKEIVCSPLTVTGSIGVFSMLPTWPKLGERIGVKHDIIKNRRHAAIYNPWTGLTDEGREHAMREVETMYDSFVDLVCEARGMSREAVYQVAEGRVWTGKDAADRKLVDGLGGLPEAIDRAKDLAACSFESDPIIVRAKRDYRRPAPEDEATIEGEAHVDGGSGYARPGTKDWLSDLIASTFGSSSASLKEALTEIIGRSPGGVVLEEIVLLTTTSWPGLPVWAYTPFTIDS